MKHCLRMMFLKFILIFVIMTIQNSNSFRKSAEIPDDCKDIECIVKLLRKTTPTIKPTGEWNKTFIEYIIIFKARAGLFFQWFCKVINEILKLSLDNPIVLVNPLKGFGEGSGDTEVGEADKHHPYCRWVRCCSPWKDGPEPKTQNPEDYKG